MKQKKVFGNLQLIRMLRKLQTLQKHMKKSEPLRIDFVDWMEGYFNISCDDSQKFISEVLMNKPENIRVIVSHYEEIRHLRKYK